MYDGLWAWPKAYSHCSSGNCSENPVATVYTVSGNIQQGITRGVALEPVPFGGGER